ARSAAATTATRHLTRCAGVARVARVAAGGAGSVRGDALAAARVDGGKAEEQGREGAITRGARTRGAAVRTANLVLFDVTLALVASAKHLAHGGFVAWVVKEQSTASGRV